MNMIVNLNLSLCIHHYHCIWIYIFINEIIIFLKILRLSQYNKIISIHRKQSITELSMSCILCQRSDPTMSVIFKSLKISHVLRSCILCHCFEKWVKHCVIIFTCMNCLEANVIDPWKCQHHREDWMAPTVKTWIWPEINVIVLKSRVYFSWHGACLVQWNGDDILFALDDGFGHGSFRSQISRFSIWD